MSLRLVVLLVLAAAIVSGCATAPRTPVSARVAAAPAAGAETAVIETGTHDGAAFRIDVPAQWNHSLVVYFHGYSTTPVELPADKPLFAYLQPMLDRRYAVIQSGYSRTGWALEQAGPETENLRRYFVAKYGVPREVFITGLSMGGALTAMTIESQPKIFAGALSLCGAIAPTDRLQQHAFALRAAFDYYFPDLLGPLVPVPADFVQNQVIDKKIAAALQNNPQAAESILRLYGAGNRDSLPGVFSFITSIIGELQQRAHGNPFGNADFIYTGTSDDFALNNGVRRYAADSDAAEYLVRWYTPTGKLSRPLLALHDTGDPLVPASTAFDYALTVRAAGRGDNFVQQYVNAEGHCVFKPEQVGRAFDELLEWVHAGKRPPAGALP